MRLINVHTEKLEEFFGRDIPRYAILSHCWGTDEVSFQDIYTTGWKHKAGSRKITYAANQANKDGFLYLWVDTCCIDKSSSAELSEAINSMFQWYSRSAICYAFLEDVWDSNVINGDLPFFDGSDYDNEGSVLEHSKWFTRGWTLQELLAPTRVEFYDQKWMHLGSKTEMSSRISIITKIPQRVLIFPREIKLQSVAKRMSWASKRETTRLEDIAYCLLGIFSIHMPLLYGEGDRAFQRLQEELIKESDDQSIFGWYCLSYTPHYGIFAKSPEYFQQSSEFVPIPDMAQPDVPPYSMTNRGLHIRLPLLPTEEWNKYIGILDCHKALDFSGRLGIALYGTTNPSHFIRSPNSALHIYSNEEVAEAELRTIYIAKTPLDMSRDPTPYFCRIQPSSLENYGFGLKAVYPPENSFDRKSNTMSLLLDPRSAFLETEYYLKAAFEYSSERHGLTSRNLIVTLNIHTTWPDNGKAWASAAIFYKPTETPLEKWFQRFEAGEFGDGSSEIQFLTTEKGNKANVRTEVSVRKETILNQNVFVVGFSIPFVSVSLGMS